MSKVAIIIGNTRPNRIGADIAHWILSVISKTKVIEFELVDIAKWPLPDDEPGVPAIHEYVHEHTKAWSRQISAADGYIFVTPRYNWGYPASLKNAIDHLYKEWTGKPAVMISYGLHGGGKAAAQLRQVLDGLKMRPTTAMPGITFTKQMLTDAGRLKDPSVDFVQYAESVSKAAEELAEKLGNNPRVG